MARQRSGRKTDYSWSGGSFNQASIATANVIETIVTFNEAGTIYRCRGNLLALLDVQAAGNVNLLGVGLMVASDAQVAAGATAFPSPIDAVDADWIWHSFLPLKSETGTQSDLLGGQVARMEIDTKAMRKVKMNDNLVMVADGQQLAGTGVVDAIAAVRVLFGH